MELADVIKSLRRHWWMPVVVVALTVAVIAGLIATKDEKRPDTRYSARSIVLVPARDKDSVAPPDVPPSLLQGQLAMATAAPTLAAAREGLPAGEADRVQFAPSKDASGQFMTMAATTDTAEVAAQGAQNYARAFLDARRSAVGRAAVGSQESIRNTILRSQERITVLEDHLRGGNIPFPPYEPETSSGAPVLDLRPSTPLDLVLDAYERNRLLGLVQSLQNDYATRAAEIVNPFSYGSIVEQLEPVASTPVAPSKKVPWPAILAVGVALGLALPILHDRLDHSIKDTKGASATLGAPVLSVITGAPRSERGGLATPGSRREVAFQTLAATAISTDRLPRAIMVTAPVGDAQDAVAANFASALASLGLRVVLVGTDPRQAWFSEVVPEGVDVIDAERLTLSELLRRAHQGVLNGELQHRGVGTKLAPFTVIPPGDDDPLKDSLDGFPPFLEALSDAQFDVAVIAGPSILENPNAPIVAWSTRAVLWAVELGEITEAQARESASRLALAGVAPFGVALVGRET